MLLWDLKDYAQMLGFKPVSPSCTDRCMHSDTITPPVLDLHQLQEVDLIVLREETPRRQKLHKDLESHQQDERKSWMRPSAELVPASNRHNRPEA